MKTLLVSMIAICAVSTAMATQPGNNGGGNGGCGVGQTTNGCGGTTPTTPTAPVYNGGQGGAGGTGLGVGVGVAAAQANAAAMGGNAAVVGSGNSTVRNTNNNANVQGQQQGQTQSSRNNNRNTNTATGGAGGQATATGGASGGNTMTAGAVTVEGDKGDVVYAPAQERAPVATAYAAPLVSSNGTCMGSTSGGVQLAGWGATGATTWTDNNCDIRYDAEALRAAGLVDAARARLCQKPEIKAAMDAAGTPCADRTVRVGDVTKTRDGKYEVVQAVTSNSIGSAVLTQSQYTDPIIRARLGLPPLK